MDTVTDGKGALRLMKLLLIPITMIGGALVAGIVVVADIGRSANLDLALDQTTFENIEFVARVERPDTAALRAALDRACDSMGCDAETLHPMILASADRMTTEELASALDAQARVQAESRAVRHRSLPGSPSARMAELEILAAERIVALYETELALR